VKYNREDGNVFVSCEILEGEPVTYGSTRCAGSLHLMVRDTGLGLTADEMARLFVPFERLGAAQTQIEGTGIGLSICKRLVEAMHGRVGVESQVGQGSTFWLELPLVEKSQTALLPKPVVAGAALMPSTPVLNGQHTILYIEDNLSNIQLIEHILSELSGQVELLPAMQASVGLDLAAQNQPELILLDVNLPDMPGEEVLRRLKTNPLTQSIPVVVLSADGTPRQVERMMAIGATQYLTKPLDVERFFHVLQEIF